MGPGSLLPDGSCCSPQQAHDMSATHIRPLNVLMKAFCLNIDGSRESILPEYRRISSKKKLPQYQRVTRKIKCHPSVGMYFAE